MRRIPRAYARPGTPRVKADCDKKNTVPPSASLCARVRACGQAGVRAYLVDEDDAREVVAVRLPPHGLALRLHALHNRRASAGATAGTGAGAETGMFRKQSGVEREKEEGLRCPSNGSTHRAAQYSADTHEAVHPRLLEDTHLDGVENAHGPVQHAKAPLDLHRKVNLLI